MPSDIDMRVLEISIDEVIDLLHGQRFEQKKNLVEPSEDFAFFAVGVVHVVDLEVGDQVFMPRPLKMITMLRSLLEKPTILNSLCDPTLKRTLSFS